MRWTPAEYAEYLRRQRAKADAPVVGLERQKSQPDPPGALDRKLARRPRRKASPVVRVTIVSCRRDYLDSDSLGTSHKGLRDEIAAQLGVDDGNPAIEWEYDQILTRGETGTMIKLELL